MVTRQEIGQRVLLRRRALGLTQQELAQRCGFPYQVISGLERGKQSVYAERLEVLARALSVSADYLLGLDTSEQAISQAAVDNGSSQSPKRTRGRAQAKA
jgi:transcriptional regulator with XRE-family HTH domain